MIWIFIACIWGVVCLALGLWVRRSLQLQQVQMQESFKALSFDVLERSQKTFLELAKGSFQTYQQGAEKDWEHRRKELNLSLDPLRDTLKSLVGLQQELEKKREGAYVSLGKQIDTLAQSERSLREETVRLTQALRSPQVRGSWGQIHLKRVVELAGLMHHCDFYEQPTYTSDGKVCRPDLVVALPGGRRIAVDAKTPLDAYLDASDEGDDMLRKKKLQEHAASLRRHMKDLSSKEYWKQFDPAPEYVILFLPAEAFYSAALQVDPLLIEVGAHQNILIATPTTLIAILRAVAYGWKQEGLSKSAREIAKIGQDLYDRLISFCDHGQKLGKNLQYSVDSYNAMIASYESRLLVSARKLKDLLATSKEVAFPERIDTSLRSLSITEDHSTRST